MSVNLLKLQPTFAIEILAPADQAMNEIRRAIASPSAACQVESAGRCVDYKIPSDQQRFWSPHLSVQLLDSDFGSTLLGRFSPRPEIWTMFMAIYFVAIFAAVAAAIGGYVQWSLGDTPWTLIGIPIGLVTVLGLHVASVIGQNLSSDQMELLRSHLDQTLAVAIDPSKIRGQRNEGGSR